MSASPDPQPPSPPAPDVAGNTENVEPDGPLAGTPTATLVDVFSQQTVIPGLETVEEWSSQRAAILADLDPVGIVEQALVERAAHLLWRLRRLGFYVPTSSQATLNAKASRALRRDLDRIARYESHLNRQLTTLLHRLKLLQDRRTATLAQRRPGRPPRVYAPSFPWSDDLASFEDSPAG